MTKKHEHTDCPTCGSGLHLDPEPHCRSCLLIEQAEEIGKLKEEITRLKKYPPIDLKRVRISAAIAAFEAMIQSWGGAKEELAADARAYADALVAELQKEVAK